MTADTRPTQDGSVLLGAAAAMLAAGLVLVVALHVGVLLRARSIAAGAADHAALAAAAALATPGGSPDRDAGRVAAAVGARVTGCRCTTLPVRVEVAVDLPDDLPVLTAVVGPDVVATGHAQLVAPP